MVNVIKVFIIGFKDGLEQPYDLTSGLTFEREQHLNGVYDRGVNMGQWVGQHIFKER